jgi:hypothetical protein
VRRAGRFDENGLFGRVLLGAPAVAMDTTFGSSGLVTTTFWHEQH